jgi:hypothetical protein
MILTDNTTRLALIDSLIADHESYVVELQALQADGYVQICGENLYLQSDRNSSYLSGHSDSTLGGLLGAFVYTDENLWACERHGVGIPSFTNGNGDKSILITRSKAQRIALDAAQAHIEFLKTL